MPTPFDYIKNINEGKRTPKLEDRSGYTKFMVNRGFSYFMDTALYANEMNIRPDVMDDMHYSFFKFALRPRKRFSKWHKADKDTKIIDAIVELYSCSKPKAREYARILTNEQQKQLIKKVNKGGKK